MQYPRELAVRVLTRVLSDREPLDEALAQVTGEVAPEARAWLQEVTAGTLRWKGRLDLALDSTALKKKPSGWLRKVLLIGCYQLIGQERTSPGAVVSETVSVVKKKEGEAPAKFANACLRKVADHAAAWRELQPQAGGSAQWASLPEWFWKKLVDQHGAEQARAFALACLERPPLWLRARDASWKPDWAEAGPIAGSWRATGGGAIPDKAGFSEGEFFVQDISSQLLVREIAAFVRETGAASALDLCAAPGGKTAGMAWEGLRVTATDREERMALLRQTVERTRCGATVIARDQVGTLPPQDLVWVDAPCTGSGIIRRHPDVRWLREPKDLDSLGKTQSELLSEAWARVRPGGFLAYSVCSILKEEGPERLEGLLKAQPAARIEKTWALWPHEGHRGDGFWAALVRKSVAN